MSDERDAQANARVGTVLNEKWTLERLIGIGGMAAVYAARHRNGARSAIKVLHADIARMPEVRERFLREGYAANRVEHPGAVKVLDDDVVTSGPDVDAAFLVMELLEGESLEDRLESATPIRERELLTITRSVLDVLEAAHASGVVHRDLKPENIFLARDPENPEAEPRVKILDFGLARVSEGRIRTVFGLAIGTPSYMPPEQAAGRVTEMDQRADIFALGATCFRILAKRTVHPASSPLEIVIRMAKEPAPRLRSVATGISAGTAEVVDRALQFKPEDRYPDAASMREGVDKAIAALSTQATHPEVSIDRVNLSTADLLDARVTSVDALPPFPSPPPPAPSSIITSPGLAPPPRFDSRRDVAKELGVPPAPILATPRSRKSSWRLRIALLLGLLVAAIVVKLALDHTRRAHEIDAGILDADNTAADGPMMETPSAIPIDTTSPTVALPDLDAVDASEAFDAREASKDASLDAAHKHARDGGGKKPNRPKPGKPVPHRK